MYNIDVDNNIELLLEEVAEIMIVLSEITFVTDLDF